MKDRFASEFGSDRAEVWFGPRGGLKVSSAVVFEGPSLIDGAPIVFIVTGLKDASTNGKTGAMVQSYFLRSDVSPMDALRTGADESICGTCTHRPKSFDGSRWFERSCYVRIDTAPTGIFKAYKRGSYPRVTSAELAWIVREFGLKFRFGSYGDPATVSASMLAPIANAARRRTGYTHQHDRARDYSAFLMFSADTVDDVDTARADGMRSFRVGALDTRRADEILCPASEEAGRLTTCDTCGLCSGARDGDRRKNIFIPAHGIGAAYT